MALPVHGAPSPQEVVAQAVERLLTTLRGREPVLRSRSCLLIPTLDRLVEPDVDFPYMAALILGRHGRGLTASQEARFTRAFRDMLMGRAARALERYVLGRGILPLLTIDYGTPRDLQGDDKSVVPARVSLRGVFSVDVRFRLRRVGGRWRIYDLRAEGFGLVPTYRMIVMETVHRRGLESVIASLDREAREARETLRCEGDESVPAGPGDGLIYSRAPTRPSPYTAALVKRDARSPDGDRRSRRRES